MKVTLWGAYENPLRGSWKQAKSVISAEIPSNPFPPHDSQAEELP